MKVLNYDKFIDNLNKARDEYDGLITGTDNPQLTLYYSTILVSIERMAVILIKSMDETEPTVRQV